MACFLIGPEVFAVWRRGCRQQVTFLALPRKVTKRSRPQFAAATRFPALFACSGGCGTRAARSNSPRRNPLTSLRYSAAHRGIGRFATAGKGRAVPAEPGLSGPARPTGYFPVGSSLAEQVFHRHTCPHCHATHAGDHGGLGQCDRQFGIEFGDDGPGDLRGSGATALLADVVQFDVRQR